MMTDSDYVKFCEANEKYFSYPKHSITGRDKVMEYKPTCSGPVLKTSFNPQVTRTADSVVLMNSDSYRSFARNMECVVRIVRTCINNAAQNEQPAQGYAVVGVLVILTTAVVGPLFINNTIRCVDITRVQRHKYFDAF